MLQALTFDFHIWVFLEVVVGCLGVHFVASQDRDFWSLLNDELEILIWNKQRKNIVQIYQNTLAVDYEFEN